MTRIGTLLACLTLTGCSATALGATRTPTPIAARSSTTRTAPASTLVTPALNAGPPTTIAEFITCNSGTNTAIGYTDQISTNTNCSLAGQVVVVAPQVTTAGGIYRAVGFSCVAGPAQAPVDGSAPRYEYRCDDGIGDIVSFSHS